MVKQPTGRYVVTMAGSRPLQARAERTRAQIIDAAAQAFAESGYDAVSLNALVTMSGVSKGAFYFHFASKQELALAAFLAKQRELFERLVSVERPPDQPAGDLLAAMLRRRNALLADDPSLACVTRLGNEMSARSAPGSPYALAQDEAIALIAEVVEAGQRRGEFRHDLDPSAAARAIFAWVIGLDALSLAYTGGKDLDERTEEMLTLLRPALLAEPRPRHGEPSQI